MTQEHDFKVSMEQSLEALQRELAEIEAQLQGIQHQRAEQERAQVAALEQEREDFRNEQMELAKRQEAILQRAMRDPFWFIDSNYGMDGGDL